MASARLFFLAASLLLVGACLAADDLVITRADRKIDLQSHVVRVILSFKVENVGTEPVGRVLLPLTRRQEETLSFSTVMLVTGKAKSRSFEELSTHSLGEGDAPGPKGSEGLALLVCALPEPLAPGGSLVLEGYLSFSGMLAPFPAEITQAESQLLLFEDDSYVPSVYPVKTQSTSIKLPSARVERFAAAEPSRRADSELRLGPYDGVAALAQSPMVVHFENNHPMPVAATLERELEVSHWGNVYVTEHYDIKHEGAKLKGVFSRLELMMRPHSSGLHSLKGLVAVLPKTVRAAYFRDEIGNISTSNLRIERKRAVLELSPRYPLFGGWSTTFTLGYSVPLSTMVSVDKSGARVLNTSFGTPFQELPIKKLTVKLPPGGSFQELPIKKLTVKVVLPEGSYGAQVVTPFGLDYEGKETKYSYLDTIGRPVVVLVKENVVQELASMPFQVRYKFVPAFLLAEPLLLVGAFAAFFVLCAVYVRMDLTIAKSSPAYQAKLQTDLLMDGVQKLQQAVAARRQCVAALERSLQSMGRTGDVAVAKAARRAQEERLKDAAAQLKDCLAAVEAIPKAPKTVQLCQQLVVKDREYVEKALRQHTVSVEAYEKSLPEKDIQDQLGPLQERLAVLGAEIKAINTLLED